MKKIIDVYTKKEIKFTKENLAMLIHGKEHSGASLLSVSLVAGLHNAGSKLCIFTAFPMAKEEFLEQIKNKEKVFYLENEKDLEEALKFQAIIVQCGNTDLFLKIISNFPTMSDRIIFVKNIETIKEPILERVIPYLFIVSGDFELNPLHQDFNLLFYKTKILFNSLNGKTTPPLLKYQAFMEDKISDKIITLKV
jgi:hypothetical protein